MMRTVYVKTTESCNLDCKHCFTGGARPPRTFFDKDKVMDWIKRFGDYVSKNDGIHFELHGGEPFLAPVDVLKEVVASMRSIPNTNVSVGATTNLVYKIKEDLFDFMMTGIDHIGTSWDAGIRFANQKQEDLWAKNLKTLITAGRSVSLNISVSRSVIEMDTDDLVKFIRDTGCYKVMFDRITPNGNANNHLDLFPSNAEINQWYLRMHESTERLNARQWFFNSALEDIYAKFEKGTSQCGTFCRDCEERNITLNADGSIGGCPNSAPEEYFGHIDQNISEMFVQPKRIEVMTGERVRNEHCFTCPVFSYCGSDCHRLAWEGDVCASPRQLMMHLAGIQTPLNTINRDTRRRVIPILSSV